MMILCQDKVALQKLNSSQYGREIISNHDISDKSAKAYSL
ncbi:MAG: hypothetical protein Ct9H300mP27_09160 [Chloroflexota bacterium]|nr:MAG: hypothetical protein Ct9H300mP27_09160 [Chloroflexota bacterium]